MPVSYLWYKKNLFFLERRQQRRERQEATRTKPSMKPIASALCRKSDAGKNETLIRKVLKCLGTQPNRKKLPITPERVSSVPGEMVGFPHCFLDPLLPDGAAVRPESRRTLFARSRGSAPLLPSCTRQRKGSVNTKMFVPVPFSSPLFNLFAFLFSSPLMHLLTFFSPSSFQDRSLFLFSSIFFQ